MNSAESNSQLRQIAEKLDVLIRLTALNLIKGIATQKEQISTLWSAGFAPKDIAAILGTTPHTIRATLYRERKDAGKDDSKASQREDEAAEIDGSLEELLTDKK